MSKSAALLLLFAVVMVLASYSMIKPGNYAEALDQTTFAPISYPRILVKGVMVGTLTGLVGAGGGFLIIPALVLLAKMPMKIAVGTSLWIIAINALSGFVAVVYSDLIIDWTLISLFMLAAIGGLFAGISLSKKFDGAQLKKGFGWFVLLMGLYIIGKELFFSKP